MGSRRGRLDQLVSLWIWTKFDIKKPLSMDMERSWGEVN